MQIEIKLIFCILFFISEFSARVTKAVVSIISEISSAYQPLFVIYDFTLVASTTSSNTTINTSEKKIKQQHNNFFFDESFYQFSPISQDHNQMPIQHILCMQDLKLSQVELSFNISQIVMKI
ncbi:unnamed protein product (macronuclear) [Paramecium tetraurelia]|uniref:Transmembrane protein n=1 Tax=Paramecium tetraurelia TaxID=5888 RepID=A0CHF6_PARTE|nr:uncharacterized protein GSPATT00038325001 [Paramecium tetraurelia]CAK70223.1 unnamed protein product [Paramecium tetraurelia]|eukprot:XP_001437620.1 hypothetical protein (macronuclear) [Paramecium tetraurelia strain d4-2]